MKFYSILAFAIILFAGSCRHTQPAQLSAEAKPVIKRYNDDSLLVSLERAACLGKCPTYKIKIYQKGFVIYNGIRNVLREGDYEGTLNADQLGRIKKFANDIKIFKINDEYQNSNLVDLPTTYIKYKEEGKLKEITDGTYNTPSELIYFEKLIDMTVDTTKLMQVNTVSVFQAK